MGGRFGLCGGGEETQHLLLLKRGGEGKMARLHQKGAPPSTGKKGKDAAKRGCQSSYVVSDRGKVACLSFEKESLTLARGGGGRGV